MSSQNATNLTLSTATVTDAAFRQYLHLVDQVVGALRRRLPSSVQSDDLLAAGRFGLLKALRSSRHASEEMFRAYARMRIKGAIVDELRRLDWAPRRSRARAMAAAAPDSCARGRAAVTVVGFDDLASDAASLATEMESPFDHVVEKHTVQRMNGAIGQLPLREREIIRLRYFEEVPSKDVALALGISEARVSQLHARATERLRGFLDESAERPLEAA